jgi:hypothetical protein
MIVGACAGAPPPNVTQEVADEPVQVLDGVRAAQCVVASARDAAALQRERLRHTASRADHCGSQYRERTLASHGKRAASFGFELAQSPAVGGVAS